MEVLTHFCRLPLSCCPYSSYLLQINKYLHLYLCIFMKSVRTFGAVIKMIECDCRALYYTTVVTLCQKKWDVQLSYCSTLQRISTIWSCTSCIFTMNALRYVQLLCALLVVYSAVRLYWSQCDWGTPIEMMLHDTFSRHLCVKYGVCAFIFQL